MIDIKAHIYSLISGDTQIKSLVGDNIHIFADDSDEMKDFDDRLPQITYARIGGVASPISGVRNETFQISAWGKTPKDAENLSMNIVRVFNRLKDSVVRYCTVEHVNDSHDRQTKAYGVHVTARFTLYDSEY